MLIWFAFGFMCAAAVMLAASYFKFASLRKAVLRAWLKLDASLQNRRDLIPSVALSAAVLPELERAFVYALSNMQKPLSVSVSASKRSAQEAALSQSLKIIFTSAQAHPELMNDEHFSNLRQNIGKADKRIEADKKRYNSAVRDFNTLAEIVPLNLVANLLEFEEFEYFDFEKSI